jgi:hypothetical protein
MLGRTDQEFVDINAIALNAAVNGSILAEPEACLVKTMALPWFDPGCPLTGRRR